ncbi:MAG: phage tail tape measure protein [Desulfovibrio sp.]|jgi:TP901 family phage tail tape measure protein|nr:phage tail tape measure protein [Desulfovibrio sp.]
MGNTALGIAFTVSAVTGASVGATFATVDARVKSLRAGLKGLQGASTKAAGLLAAEGHLQKAQRAHLANPTEKTALALKAAQARYNSAERAASKYNITMKNAAQAHAATTAQIEKTTAALASQQKFQANKAMRREIQGEMMATVATVATVAAPVKLAIDYESAMADVKKVTNFDAPGFKQFSDDMLALSTRIPMSAEGLAKIAAAAGQAGIAESELLRFTEDAAKMAVAFDISADEAGSAMTGLRTNFKLNQDGVISLGDAYNHLANNMDATAGDLVNFANRVGGTASIYKFTGQQVGALGATFVAMKTPAEVGARAANALMMKLGNAATQGKDAQAAFQRLGFSGKGMSEAFKKDAQGSMLMFLEAVKKSSDPMRELNAIMGEGFADEIAKLVSGLDEYKKALGLVGDEAAYAGSMEAEYAARSQTTANALELLKNSGARLGITIGSVLLKPIAALAALLQTALDPVISLANSCPVLTGGIMTVAVAFAAAKLAALGGMYAWSILSDGWLVLRGAGSRLLGVVRILPMLFKAATYQMLWQRGAAIATSASMRLQAAATWVVTTAQKALNLAMSGSPIGIVIKVVAAAATALFGLYQTCEPVRAAVDTVISAIKDAFWSVVKTVATVYDKVSGFFGGKGTAVADLESYLGKTEEAAKAAVELTRAQVTPSSGVPGLEAKGSTPTLKTETARPGSVPAMTAQANAQARAAVSASGSSAPAPRPPVNAAAGGVTPQINFSVSFSGVPSKDVGEVLVNAVKSRESALVAYFEKMLANIASNQRRLAYDQ